MREAGLREAALLLEGGRLILHYYFASSDVSAALCFKLVHVSEIK